MTALYDSVKAGNWV